MTSVHTIRCIVYIGHCTLYDVQCTLYIVHYTLFGQVLYIGKIPTIHISSTGNMLRLKPNREKRLMDNVQDLVDQYGPMVHLNIGMGVDIVILNGTDVSCNSISIDVNGTLFTH